MISDKIKEEFEKRIEKFIFEEDCRFYVETGYHFSEINFRVVAWDDKKLIKEGLIGIKVKRGIPFDDLDLPDLPAPKHKLMEFSSKKELNEFLESKGLDTTKKWRLYKVDEEK